MTGRRQKASEGNTYLTRTAALRKLQLPLSSFRKLCILKGVYPREPKKRKNPNKIYYLKKDIMFLYHDPIVEKIREQKIYKRKMASAEGLKDRFKLIQLKLQFPTYSLDHIMRERYATFQDALRDLDDALSLVVLIAQLPQTRYLQKSRVVECERLILEFESFVVRSHSLHKVFVSVKGIYYQAVIQDIPITWLVPHEHAGSSNAIETEGIKIKILLNFVELYEAMLGFVFYKLYHTMGLRYPPLPSLQLQKNFATVQEQQENEDIPLHYYLNNLDAPPESKSTVDVSTSSTASSKTEERLKTLNQQKLIQLDPQDKHTMESQPTSAHVEDKNLLFSGKVFYLAREVPRHALYFVIRSCGGKVLFKESDENDDSITHHIIDRNALKKKVLSRVYVQPQWVFDCLNEQKILRTDEYGIGAQLPPHLSPFVDDSSEGYLPERREQLLKLGNFLLSSSTEAASDEAEGEEQDIEEEDEDDEEEPSNGKTEVDILENPEEPKELTTEFQVAQPEPVDNTEEELYQQGLAAELKGEAFEEAPQPAKKPKKSTTELLQAKKKLASIVLSGKKKKVLDRVLNNDAKAQQKKQNLLDKRKALKKAEKSAKKVKA